MAKLLVGISACLLGEQVRYDGQHKLDLYLRDTLGRYVEYVPICPEAECGLPVPREPMHLAGNRAAPRLITNQTGRDLTAQLCRWMRRRLRELEQLELAGLILKSRSPSCGVHRVKLCDEHERPRRVGTGLFAAAVIKRFPALPVEEDERLHDPALRDSFIEQLFVLQRWRETLGRGRRRGALAEFHARHKLLLLAHSPVHERELGCLAARRGGAELFGKYLTQLRQALRVPATAAKHATVLRHALGSFMRQLTVDEQLELREMIELLRQGQLPLLVPLTLIAHHVRRLRLLELAAQVYLQPQALELKLRNHA